MCGIAGVIGGDGPATARRAIVSGMIARIRHRGPESVGLHSTGESCLAACELAFVAPGQPHQPVASDCGRIAVALNGEIYNHAELRQWLRVRGVAFHTDTDTELVLRLYQSEGAQLVHRLRGMYAIAIVDQRSQRTLLVRDPLGKKPLYWFSFPGGLAFGSELSAVTAHPQCPRRVSLASLGQFFVFNAVASPATMLEGVAKLAPGTLLEAQDGRLEVRCYWRPATPAPGRAAAGDDEAVVLALRRAVERRLTSTALPLGFLVSGGLDSSLIVALAAELSYAPLRTFSAAFEEQSFDESRHARLLARHFGTEHHEARLSNADLARLAEVLLATIDEPLADPSLLPTAAVCALARSEVKGVLSGDGADELFLGYDFFRFERLLALIEPWLSRPLLGTLQWLAGRIPVQHTRMHPSFYLPLLARALQCAPERRFHVSTAAVAPDDLPALLEPDVRAQLGRVDPFGEIDALMQTADHAPRMRRAQLGLMRHFLQDVILTKVDRASMLHALEVRCPYLDLDVAETALSLLDTVGLRRSQTKPRLRRLARRYLPPALASRPKQGFRIPLAKLLCSDLRPFLHDHLSPAALRRAGFFAPQAVGTLIRQHERRERNHQKPLWALLCFHAWLENGRLARADTDAGAREVTVADA